jgi:hypothetical protein
MIRISDITDRAPGVGAGDGFRPREGTRYKKRWICCLKVFLIPVEVEQVRSQHGQVRAFAEGKVEIPQ